MVTFNRTEGVQNPVLSKQQFKKPGFGYDIKNDLCTGSFKILWFFEDPIKWTILPNV